MKRTSVATCVALLFVVATACWWVVRGDDEGRAKSSTFTPQASLGPTSEATRATSASVSPSPPMLIQDAYDRHLLMLYKLEMEERVHLPYNYYGNESAIEDASRAPPILDYRFLVPPYHLRAKRAFREDLLRETLVGVTARFAELETMHVPDHVRQCYRNTTAAPDRLALASRPQARHDTKAFFQLSGNGIDPNTTAFATGNRQLSLTIRVRQDIQDQQLWYRCGDLFEVRVRTRRLAWLELPAGVIPTFVIDNFNYSYTVLFTMPRNASLPRGEEWEVEVLHEKHRFNQLRSFPGTQHAGGERSSEFLSDFIEGSPFPFRFHVDPSSDEPLADLPIAAAGARGGAVIESRFVPDHAVLVDANPTNFSQCAIERNYCIGVWGDSINNQVFEKLSYLLPADRVFKVASGRLSWLRESQSDWKDVLEDPLESLRISRDAGMFWTLGEPSPVNCSGYPGVRLVNIFNSGIHPAAWQENYPLHTMGVEWLVRNYRELFPTGYFYWRRTTALHLRRITDRDPSKESVLLADYLNTISQTRVDLFDLMDRRTMAAFNVSLLEGHMPTRAAVEWLINGDARHYIHEAFASFASQLYAELCLGPVPDTIGQRMMPGMVVPKTEYEMFIANTTQS